ncbi:ubiquitin-specific protease doa4 [Mucor velutinosus]|uniref:Ubiquitin-specific protease doa4 n=1 Tax=Mucor velutinosus TaxID=708070 RepID=A0AAN7HWC4_9FUNG|nr:ubiquitin-specific protease doa4 [Mucor velutinosus]
MNATLGQSVANNQNGAYAFRIHGSVYHLMSSALMPANDTRPKIAQMYIFDGENELQNRLNVAGNPNMERTTVRLLQNMMHKVNPFVDLFKTMEELSVEQPGGIQNIRMIFRSEDSPDPRRYNRPRVPEIGVLLFDGDDESSNEQPKNRDVVLRLKGSGDNLTRINETNQFFDPLQYVLIDD